MLFSPVSVVKTPDVPVGSFFWLKPQNGGLQLAFMAQQTAKKDGEFTGPVVLLIPEEGACAMPQAASRYTLGIAAVLSPVEVFASAKSIASSSTEAMSLPMGTVLMSDKGALLPVAAGDMGDDNYVNLRTGQLVLNGNAGDWLAFDEFEYRLEDGTSVRRVVLPE